MFPADVRSVLGNASHEAAPLEFRNKNRDLKIDLIWNLQKSLLEKGKNNKQEQMKHRSIHLCGPCLRREYIYFLKCLKMFNTERDTPINNTLQTGDTWAKASLHSAASTVDILLLFIRYYRSITQKQKGIKHLSEPAYFNRQKKGAHLGSGHLSWWLNVLSASVSWQMRSSQLWSNALFLDNNPQQPSAGLNIWVRDTDTDGNWLAFCWKATVPPQGHAWGIWTSFNHLPPPFIRLIRKPLKSC